MLDIKKILVPTDFSDCAEKALQKGVQLAKYHKAELHVIHITILPAPDPFAFGYYYPDISNMKETVEKNIKDQLNTIQKNIQDDIVIKTAQESGYNVTSHVETYIEDNEIDFVVVGTHGHTGIERKLLGSTSEDILKYVKCPVMTVHYESQPLKEINRICVPIDFSPESKKSLSVAVEFAKKWGAILQLIHIIVSPKDVQYMLSHIQLGDDAIEKSEKALRDFIKDIVPKDIKFSIDVKIKASSHYITEYCDSHDTDMIIMSTHGYTGLKKFFLGSTAETVVRSTRLPLIVLK